MFIKRIKWRLYLMSTIVFTVLLTLFVELNTQLVVFLFLTLIASLINHFMLLYGINVLFEKGDVSSLKRKIAITFLFLKFIILAVLFWFAVEYLGDQVLIPVILYTFQLIIFLLSIKNISKLAF